MNIAEMHVWFRQYAQQMGLQNVRAILPEQIDLLINTSITDTINQLIRENIGLTNDRVITDNSKLGQINALRTLYKVKTIDMSPETPVTRETRAFVFNASDRNTGKMTTDFNKISNESLIPDYLFLVDFSLNYKQVSNNFGYSGYNNVQHYANLIKPLPDGTKPVITVVDNKTFVINTPIMFDNSASEGSANKLVSDVKVRIIGEEEDRWLEVLHDDRDIFNPSYSYRLCITPVGDYIYTKEYSTEVTNAFGDYVIDSALKAYTTPIFSEEALETNYFPVRLIDDAYLADTLNDFVLRNRLRSPILVTYNNGTFDIYIDKFKQVSANGSIKYVLDNNLLPYKFRMSYISKPAMVRYSEDIGGENVDCDLPEAMHVDILKHAVDLYNIAIQGNLYSAQQQQQAQNRELSRNQARPDNEGYQS